MAKDSPDEVVFAVAGSTARVAERISLIDAGLREREHLQEWVIAHPEIIGPDVMIVTFEFDRWSSAAGAQKDRLDVLGLGQDGRIVVAELKRGRAPDTVDMQALKYAAMASRFKPGLLAEYHARFTRRDDQQGGRQGLLTEAEALSRLETHSDVGLLPDKLINPRVVLLAESFPPNVTATAVWLNERGIDLTLMRYQAYRTGPDHIILTVSQLYPVREVADFEVAPHTSTKSAAAADIPEIAWTQDKLASLAEVANATTLAIVDLCALSPDSWIAASEAYERAGVTTASGTGQLGGFGITVRSRFGRINPPYDRQWAAGGTNQAYYRMGADLAAAWLQIRGSDISAGQSQTGDIVPVPGGDSQLRPNPDRYGTCPPGATPSTPKRAGRLDWYWPRTSRQRENIRRYRPSSRGGRLASTYFQWRPLYRPSRHLVADHPDPLTTGPLTSAVPPADYESHAIAMAASGSKDSWPPPDSGRAQSRP
jgi:hypothetical protein